jgi:hypothetical protein
VAAINEGCCSLAWLGFWRRAGRDGREVLQKNWQWQTAVLPLPERACGGERGVNAYAVEWAGRRAFGCRGSVAGYRKRRRRSSGTARRGVIERDEQAGIRGGFWATMMMRPSALSRSVPSASGGDAAVRRQRMLRRVWVQALVFSPRQSLITRRTLHSPFCMGGTGQRFTPFISCIDFR